MKAAALALVGFLILALLLGMQGSVDLGLLRSGLAVAVAFSGCATLILLLELGTLLFLRVVSGTC